MGASSSASYVTVEPIESAAPSIIPTSAPVGESLSAATPSSAPAGSSLASPVSSAPIFSGIPGLV